MNAAARVLHQSTLSRNWVVSLFWTRFQFTLFILVFSTLISALSVVYITNNTRSLNASIQQALVERNQLHVEWGQLLLEKSTWLMQAHIQNVAENKLGMVVPDHKAVVMVRQ